MKRLSCIIVRSIRYSTFAPKPPATQTIAPTKEPPKNDPFSQPTPDFKYSDLAANPFPDNVIKVLSNPIDPLDVEVKPDGILYVPEIKYRRLLMQAFGPGFQY